MTTVDCSFMKELERFGMDKTSDCFNCGTCVAVCPLGESHFPREIIRYAQIGAREKIIERAYKLWRCLHCGLCIQTCPRGADPGELIMGLRRYMLHLWREKKHV